MLPALSYMLKVRIFKILAGLNPEFDQIRSKILGMEPLPSLREVLAYVQNEESRRSVMLLAPSTEGPP